MEVADGVIYGGGKNRHYMGVEVGGKDAKVATAGMRLAVNERVKVRLVWVSGDGRDAEYEIVERYEQPEEEQPSQAVPVGFEGQVMPKPDREVIEPIEDVVPVAVALEETPTAAEKASEPAEDYLEKARRQAAEWANKTGGGGYYVMEMT